MERKEILERIPDTPPSAQVTFKEVAARFMQFHAEIRYKPNTYNQARQLLEHHIFPEPGNLPIGQITPFDIETFFVTVRNKPKYMRSKWADGATLSTSTLATIYSIVNQIFKRAVVWQYIAASSCALREAKSSK